MDKSSRKQVRLLGEELSVLVLPIPDGWSKLVHSDITATFGERP